MFFRKLPYILYRDYPDFGYLTDNRNFGYDTASKSCLKVGDRILSKTGSIFYSVLTEKAQSISELSQSLVHLFRGVSLQEIENDAQEFFLELSKDGFVWCCEDVDKSIQVDYFSYSNLNSRELIEADDSYDGHLYVDGDSEYRLSRVHVDISGLCNERCVHCYIPDSFRDKTMPFELFKEIIDQSKECRALNITISGGEPMLNPNLLRFIALCRDNNFSVNLLSNLTLLTNAMIYEFKKTPLLSIQTSLYSMIETVHDSITNVRGSYIKTKRSIEILHEHDIPIQINCPVMKQNKDSYTEVLDWARTLNIEASRDYMLFGCFDGSGKNLKCRLEPFEIEDIMMKEIKRGIGIQKKRMMSQLNTSNLEPSFICPICLSSLCVSHTGDVYPCEGWQSLILGNINDTTLLQIWKTSIDIQKLRGLTLDDFSKCSTCDNKNSCSICLIRNVNESPNLDFKDVNPYFCKISKIISRLERE